MPAAIPIVATVGSALLGSALQNGQNKANQKNATNATASARTADAAALQTALANLKQYQTANPSPASQYANVKAPVSVYGERSAIGSPTQQVGAPPSAAPTNVAQPAAPSAPASPTTSPTNVQGLVAALLGGGSGGYNGVTPISGQGPGTRLQLPPGLT